VIKLAEFLGSLNWRGLLIAAVIFLATFLASAAIVSFVVVKLPATYFKLSHARDFLPYRHPWVRLIGLFAKNLLGVLLVAAGIIMSVPGVPGQGVLTILLGIMLLDFPGKRRLEHKLVSRPPVFEALNGLRAKFGKPPLIID
jgi:hypothetical protein